MSRLRIQRGFARLDVNPRAKKTLHLVRELLQTPLNLGDKPSSAALQPLHLLCPKCGQFALVRIKYVPP
ncbi:MAG: hypothetical protein ACR2OZ_12225 [Verrucomicrobiales bacterium]